jgi:putative tryptophan/tyrosine transport system substrate-binding protein
MHFSWVPILSSLARAIKWWRSPNRYAVPAIYPFREDVEAGGLASYGGSNRDGYHLMGGYAGRILSGEKPGDLPVQQATRLKMALNLKTAKALGLTIPRPVLGRADEVIE